MGTPQPFGYQVRVQAKDTLSNVSNAKVTILVGGTIAPLDSYTDSNGIALLQVDASRIGKQARLIVEAVGYKTAEQNITLTEGALPQVMQLEATVAVVSTPPPQDTVLPTTAIPIESTAPQLGTEPATLPSGSPLTATPIVSDSFTKPDNSDIGPNWKVQKGTFEIRSNQLHLKMHDPERIKDVDADIATWEPALPFQGADYDVEADVNMKGKTGDVFIIARWQDMGNMYVAELSTYDKGVHLWRVVDGKLERLKDASGDYNTNQTYKLRLSVKGNTLSLYVNGQHQISTEDTSITNTGKAAIGTDVDDVTWDNFAVYSNATQSSSTSQTLPIQANVSEFEQQLAEANVLLTGAEPLTSQSDRLASVRGYLRDDDAYQQLATNLLQLLQGKRFKMHVHLDTINGTYKNFVEPGAEYIQADRYNDIDKLISAVLNHWNSDLGYPQAASFDQIVEPKP